MAIRRTARKDAKAAPADGGGDAGSAGSLLAPLGAASGAVAGEEEALSADQQRRRLSESWKRDPLKFKLHLQNTVYDHLQIADELARNEDMEPKDRLRALSDYAKNAQLILEALDAETEKD